MTRWLRRFEPRASARVRLFCLPYAGGGASAFHRWSRELPGSVEVWAVQPPGREDRLAEPAHAAVPPMVEELSAAMEPYVERPVALFGHSLGAVVAFELSRRLRQTFGVSPAALFVSARPAPDIPYARPPRSTLDDAGLLRELRRMGGTPEALLEDSELMRLALPRLRADFRASETYRFTPGAPLACPVWAFAGTEDDEVAPEEVRAWGCHTTGAFHYRELSGGHFFIDTARSDLLEAVAGGLAAATA